MYLTGMFNIPAASTGIVKVMFADISIITFHFQCLRFSPEIVYRPQSNSLYKISVCTLLLLLLLSFSTLKLLDVLPSQNYEILK